MEKRKICWLSAGVSSFIAGYLAENVDEYIYIDIKNQHPDSMRFIKDCEKILNKKITILKSDLESVENAIRKAKCINTPYGAPCTKLLKKQVRLKWEQENKYDFTYVWGYDYNEIKRAERLQNSFPEYHHEFPLIENHLTKEDAHGLLKRLGVKRPAMYDLGYNNNNCVGCVKGGQGYWNKIRVDFPEVFKRMAKLEREIGNSCINGIYLDELPEEKGRLPKPILEDCSIFCEEVI